MELIECNRKEKNTAGGRELYGDTICSRFTAFFAKHKKVSDIIDFLNEADVEVIRELGKCGHDPERYPKEKQDDLVDFTSYFMDNFEEITASARMKEFGENDAFCLRLGMFFIDKRFVKLREEYLNMVDQCVYDESVTLARQLFYIKKNRVFRFYLPDAPDEPYELSFPEEIPEELVNEAKRSILYTCALMIDNNGWMEGITVTSDIRPIVNIFEVRANGGRWIPVPGKEVRDHHTLTKSGIRLEAEDNFRFDELEKKVYCFVPKTAKAGCL